MADDLGGVVVGGFGGVVGAVDLWKVGLLITEVFFRLWREGIGMRDLWKGWGRGLDEVGVGRTASMAFLTRSDVMTPLLVRFLIRAALVEPLDIHAMFLRICRTAGDVVGRKLKTE